MTYALEFELAGLPPMNTADGMHWRTRKRHRDQWEAFVSYAVRNRPNRKPKSPLPKARVTITRHSTREPDFENLTQGGKFILDGLVKCGVLEDDCPRVIGQPEYHWQKAKPREGKVRVRVESIEADSGVEIGPRITQNENNRNEGK